MPKLVSLRLAKKTSPRIPSTFRKPKPFAPEQRFHSRIEILGRLLLCGLGGIVAGHDADSNSWLGLRGGSRQSLKQAHLQTSCTHIATPSAAESLRACIASWRCAATFKLIRAVLAVQRLTSGNPHNTPS